MKLRLPQRFRYLRARGHAWLQTHPRTLDALEFTGCLRKGPEAIARGVFIGIFVGLTPTVGGQTLLMILGCMALRGNFPSAFAVSWVSNPFTVAPLYWLFHGIGKGVFQNLSLFDSNAWFVQGIGDDIVFAGLGSLLLALPAAFGSYFLSHRISAALLARRAARVRA